MVGCCPCPYGPCSSPSTNSGVFTIMLIRYFEFHSKDGWWIKGVVVASAILAYAFTGEYFLPIVR